MKPKFTDNDLARFASVGFPGQVPPMKNAVSSEELVESTVKVFQHPSPRLVEAAVLVLRELADRKDLQLFEDALLNNDGVRRLAYLAERLAEFYSDSPRGSLLEEFADGLEEGKSPTFEPLTLSLNSASFLKRKMEDCSATNRRWGVYGDPTFEFLAN